ncbi:MAG: hypothetical protein AB7P21_26025 [Lautropia sp.]
MTLPMLARGEMLPAKPASAEATAGAASAGAASADAASADAASADAAAQAADVSAARAPFDLDYRSAFSNYRRADEQSVDWREANETAARAGGWRAYLREAHRPDAPSPTPVPSVQGGPSQADR